MMLRRPSLNTKVFPVFKNLLNLLKKGKFCVDNKPFELTACMARNYNALQNFLSNTTIDRKRNRSSSTNANEKRHARKVLMLSAQNFKCVDCDFVFNPNNFGHYPTATADHVIPFRYGGTLDHNYEYVCEPCNHRREKNRMSTIIRFFGSI